MLLFRLTLVPLLLAGCAPARAAPEAPPAVQAGVAGEASLQAVNYFVGVWSAVSRDSVSGSEMTLTYRVEPALGGAWLAGAGESADGGFRSRDMWGRDVRTGEVVRIVFVSSGDHAVFRSPGWKGDTLVLQGEVWSGGSKLPLRQTITRIGPNEFGAVWEAFREGAWRASSTERLTRLPA